MSIRTNDGRGWQHDAVVALQAEEAGRKVAEELAERRAEAMRKMSRDMHRPSNRGCATCAEATAALGEPFGCDAFRIEKAARGRA